MNDRVQMKRDENGLLEFPSFAEFAKSWAGPIVSAAQAASAEATRAEPSATQPLLAPGPRTRPSDLAERLCA